MTPMQRSLKVLREFGWQCAIVEKWNSHVGIRQDLWGFADILAIREDTCLLVQTTSGSNVAERVQKIRLNAQAETWLGSPYRQIEVHGWRKVGPRGKRKVWECRVVRIYDDGITEGSLG